MRDPPIDLELSKLDRTGLQHALLAVLGALFRGKLSPGITGQCARGLKLPVITCEIGGLTRFK